MLSSGGARILIGGTLLGVGLLRSVGGGPRTQVNFRKFSKNFFRKLLKMHYFSIFLKKFSKPCVNFSRVRTKNTNGQDILKFFDKNSMEKVNFFTIFRKFVTKRAFGNNIIFSTTIFPVSGGIFRSFLQWIRLCYVI